jgi:hypothetical protein
LGKGHTAELVLATEALDRTVTAVTLNTAAEAVLRQVIHQLGENQFPFVHRPIPWLSQEGAWSVEVETKFKSVTHQNPLFATHYQ